MKNLIYEGQVIHHRFRPREHQFTYKVSYYFVNLENPPQEIQIFPFLTFDHCKYLHGQEIRFEMNRKFGAGSGDRVKNIFILTQLSYFGFCFNPVSFYYCYGQEGELLYVVSLITNTPWGEKHLNLFDFQSNLGQEHFKKDFHVSPFMPMEIDYNWEFSPPDDKFQIQMFNQLKDENDPFFFVQMNLNAKELSRKNVLKNWLSFPIMSFKTVWGIYWQAFILYLKKIPFYTHPKKREIV